MMLLNSYRFASGGGGPAVPVAFSATGAEQDYIVPAGVTQVRAYCIGAAGGGGSYSSGSGASGAGGYSVGIIATTPGETLKVRVGSGGQGGQRTPTPMGGLGGYPGGGSGAYGDTFTGGGGGYSGVFRGTTPLIIAGAGGGSTGYNAGGGNGGGASGQAGNNANGGTQSAGGSGAYPGSSLQGGNANAGNRTTFTAADSGGGGGGYFGGGASGGDGQSGGGGSGYIGGVTSANTYLNAVRGSRPAEVPATIAGFSTTGYGVGVNSVTSGNGTDGSNGYIVLEPL
jgi:hypothetical protein